MVLRTFFRMSRIRSELAHLKTFIFDCDGVLWRGNEKLPHVANFMKLLRAENKNVFFVTNNSTKTRSQYVSKFGKHDIQGRDSRTLKGHTMSVGIGLSLCQSMKT